MKVCRRNSLRNLYELDYLYFGLRRFGHVARKTITRRRFSTISFLFFCFFIFVSSIFSFIFNSLFSFAFFKLYLFFLFVSFMHFLTFFFFHFLSWFSIFIYIAWFSSVQMNSHYRKSKLTTFVLFFFLQTT